MKRIKRHFYNGKEYHLDHVKKVIVLSDEFKTQLQKKKLWNRFGFKKIGGSNIGQILKCDKFKSPFAAFARMAWIDIPVLDKKYINAGITIEPKVVDLLLKQPGIKSIDRFEAKDYDYDYFKKDPVFGGLPDGVAHPSNVLIEIKTTGEKNKASWEKWGIPISYLKQAQLYTYLMKLNRFAIVATFLREEDYVNPKQFNIKDRKTKTWFHKLDKHQIEDDMQHVRDWYKKHTKSGISPQYNRHVDQDLIDYLECSTPEEWDELIAKWDARKKINWESLK